MAARKKKGTIERAQDALLKAVRDFEKTVSGLVSSSAPKKTKKKTKKKAKTAKRKTKAARKGK